MHKKSSSLLCQDASLHSLEFDETLSLAVFLRDLVCGTPIQTKYEAITFHMARDFVNEMLYRDSNRPEIIRSRLDILGDHLDLLCGYGIDRRVLDALSDSLSVRFVSVSTRQMWKIPGLLAYLILQNQPGVKRLTIFGRSDSSCSSSSLVDSGGITDAKPKNEAWHFLLHLLQSVRPTPVSFPSIEELNLIAPSDHPERITFTISPHMFPNVTRIGLWGENIHLSQHPATSMALRPPPRPERITQGQMLSRTFPFQPGGTYNGISPVPPPKPLELRVMVERPRKNKSRNNNSQLGEMDATLLATADSLTTLELCSMPSSSSPKTCLQELRKNSVNVVNSPSSSSFFLRRCRCYRRPHPISTLLHQQPLTTSLALRHVFPNLKFLSIGMRELFGSLVNMRLRALPDVLPRSLHVLHMRENWSLLDLNLHPNEVPFSLVVKKVSELGFCMDKTGGRYFLGLKRVGVEFSTMERGDVLEEDDDDDEEEEEAPVADKNGCSTGRQGNHDNDDADVYQRDREIKTVMTHLEALVRGEPGTKSRRRKTQEQRLHDQKEAPSSHEKPICLRNCEHACKLFRNLERQLRKWGVSLQLFVQHVHQDDGDDENVLCRWINTHTSCPL